MKIGNINMLEGSLWDKIILFALPLAFTAFLQQMYNAADVAVLGQFVGTEAMAAVSTNISFIGLLVNLFGGVSLGANVMVARFIGGGDVKKVRAAVHTSFLLAIMTGLGILAVGEIFAVPLLNLLAVPANVFDLAETYLRVYLIGMPFMGLYNFQSAIFRSRGDTATPLIVLAMASALNLVLDLYFAAVLNLGIAGVAAATGIAQLFAATLLYLKLSRRGVGIIRLNLRLLHWDSARIKEIINIGLPAAIQGMVFSLSNIVIQAAINGLGADTMAASAAAFTIEINVYCFIFAFAQAATTFVSQNYGAGNLARCRRVTLLSLGLGILFMGTLGAIIIYFGEKILTIFAASEEVIRLGMIRIWYVIAPEFLSCIIDVLSGSMRGYGISLPPAILALVGICGVRLTWVYFIFPMAPTYETLMACYPASWLVTAVFIAIAYRWSLKHIRPTYVSRRKN